MEPTSDTTKLGTIADWYANHYWILTVDGWQTRCGLTPNVSVQRAVRYYPNKQICPEPGCRDFDRTRRCPLCARETLVLFIDGAYLYRCETCGTNLVPEGR
jgi:hypothetical protein